MFGWYGIFLSDWREGKGDKMNTRGGRVVEGGTYLELLEFFTLVPTAFPSFLHPLDGYESLVGVLWTCTWTALHGGERCIGG